MSDSGNKETFSVREQFATGDPLSQQPDDRHSPSPGIDAPPPPNHADGTDEPVGLCRSVPPGKWYLLLDLTKIGISVLHRSWIPIVLAVVAAFPGLIVGRKMSSTSFGAEALLLYRKGGVEAVRTGGSSAFKLASLSQATAISLIKTHSVLKKAAELGGLEMTPEDLGKHLEVHLERKSEVVRLVLTGVQTEDHAITGVNSIAAAAVMANQQFYTDQVEQMAQVFRDRAENARRKLETVEARIRAFQEEHRLLELSADHKAYLDRVAAAADKLNSARLEVEGLEVRSASYRRLMESMPEQVLRESYEDNPLKRRMANTEVALLEARTRYGPQNPRVKQLQAEIDELRRALNENTSAGTTQQVYQPNPQRQRLSNMLLTLAGDLDAARNKAEKLKDGIDALSASFQGMPGRDWAFQRLTAERTIAQDFVDTLQRSADEAALVATLGLGDLSELEQAIEAGTETSKLGLVLPVFAIACGAVGGLVLVIAAEAGDFRVTTRRQLALWYTVPCVAELKTTAGTDADDTPPPELLETCRRLRDTLPGPGATDSAGSLVRVACVSPKRSPSSRNLAWRFAAYMAGQGIRTSCILWNGSDQTDEVRTLGRPPSVLGLEAFLRDEASYRAVREEREKVLLFSVGANTEDLPELARSPAFSRLQHALRQDTDLLCMDIPPMDAETAATPLGRTADRLFVVIDRKKVWKFTLDRELRALEAAGVRPAGLILVHGRKTTSWRRLPLRRESTA